MRSKTLVAVATLFALAAPGGAKVRVVVQGGKKIIYNDGVGERSPGAVRRAFGEQWLAARISRPSRYDSLIRQAANDLSLDPRLVKSVMLVESGFNTAAVSAKGARGLMQLMPRTASRQGVADVHDPAQNIEGGVRYLSYLLGLFKGDLEKSLAAYNAGEGAVARYGGIPPYSETRDYVRKALSAYYGTPYVGARTLGGGFGKPAGKPVQVGRDSKNRPLLTTDRRPPAPAPRPLG